MGGIEDRNAIQLSEVLIGLTTPHIEPDGVIVRGDRAGHELNGAQNVGFTEARELHQSLPRDIHYAWLHELLKAFARFQRRLGPYGIELNRHRLQEDVQGINTGI